MPGALIRTGRLGAHLHPDPLGQGNSAKRQAHARHNGGASQVCGPHTLCSVTRQTDGVGLGEVTMSQGDDVQSGCASNVVGLAVQGASELATPAQNVMAVGSDSDVGDGVEQAMVGVESPHARQRAMRFGAPSVASIRVKASSVPGKSLEEKRRWLRGQLCSVAAIVGVRWARGCNNQPEGGYVELEVDGEEQVEAVLQAQLGEGVVLERMPSVGPENSVRVLGVPPEGNLLEVRDALRRFGAIRTVRLGNASAGIGQVAFATFEEVGAAAAARGQSYAFICKDRVRIVCVQGQGQGSAHLEAGFRLRLSNLPRGMTDWELRELMAGVGALHWHVPRVEGRVEVRKRFAMVDFPSRECMEGAMGRVLDFRGG